MFLYHHIEQKKTKSDAAMETMKLVEYFWERARIPTQKPMQVKENIIRLYEQWVALKKNKNRKIKSNQKTNEQKFVDSLINCLTLLMQIRCQ